MAKSNLAASVRQLLLNRARTDGDDFQLLLVRYANERFLYRLGRSSFRNSFVLKGATLFSVWAGTPHRATRDVDLLGSGEVTEEHLRVVFTELLQGDEDDGLLFEPDSVQVRPIREDNIYGGLRVTFTCRLASARISMQVDVGIGDAHDSVEVEVPSVLSFPPARLEGYRRETVIAEKLEAAVTLGVANSRMKDFYDLATLSQEYSFEGRVLQEAIERTFQRRNTKLPTQTLSELLAELGAEPSKPLQWKAFVRKATPRTPWTLLEALDLTAAFLEAPLRASVSASAFEKNWPQGGPWRPVGGHKSKP